MHTSHTLDTATIISFSNERGILTACTNQSAEVIILLIKRPDDLSTAPVHGGAMGSIRHVWFRREIIPLVFTIQNNYPVAVISPVGIITKCWKSKETFVPPK